MKHNSVPTIALASVVTGMVAMLALGSITSARAPSYAVKAQVLDKSTADSWVEIRVLEQTKGKTSILGDQVIVRVLKTTSAYNKSNVKRTTSSWLSSVQNSDLVSVLGEYKTTDGTIWASKLVNRSR